MSFDTTFGTYVVDELLGEGGAGRVYGGVGIDNARIALKVLSAGALSSDKRKRFKNEIAFLAKNKHKNIVTVIDHGLLHTDGTPTPFYVMPRYDSNLRELMRTGIQSDAVLPLFSQILDGVEAAHLQDVVHRDLKPENILWEAESKTLAIADFGTARFTEDVLATTIETGPAQRLANFQYAAPEQRAQGRSVEASADIYALGLILNEMFTGTVPHGTGYRSVGDVAKEHSFLDGIVEKAIRQTPEERPASVEAIKRLVQRYREEAVSLQRLSRINETVINARQIDEPLAETPPQLVDFDWDGNLLTLTLDRSVTPDWINALQGMGAYSSVMGKPPHLFSFSRLNQASISARKHEIQLIIDNFKTWLPLASRTLKGRLEETARRQESDAKGRLRREKELEEERMNVKRTIKI
jgi:serine/threonine protein kinase